jgi:hypothetical protein
VYLPSGSRTRARPSSACGADQARTAKGRAIMRMLLEITPEGAIIDDGEVYDLYDFDPEAVSNDPLE